MLNDTICVISTPLAEGAIGIVRLSGDKAIEIVDCIFDRDPKKKKSHITPIRRPFVQILRQSSLIFMSQWRI